MLDAHVSKHPRIVILKLIIVTMSERQTSHGFMKQILFNIEI